MPANKETYELDTSQAARQLDELQQRAERLRQTLETARSTLGSAAGQDPGFRMGLRELAATQGAASSMQAVMGSAIPGAWDPRAVIEAGVKAGQHDASVLLGQREAPSISAIVEAARNAGAAAPMEMGLNTRAVVSSLMQSAQVTAIGGGATGAIDPTLLLPTARQIGGFGPMPGTPLSTTSTLYGVATSSITGDPTMMMAAGGMVTGAQAAGRLPAMSSRAFMRGALSGGAFALEAAVDYGTESERTGVYKPSGAIEAGARGIGSIIGGFAGALTGNPWVAAAGAAAGGEILQRAADWVIGGAVRGQEGMTQLSSVTELWNERWSRGISDDRRGILPIGVGTPTEAGSVEARWARMGTISASANHNLSYFWSKERSVSDLQVAQTWSGVSEAMLAGGLDPRQFSGTRGATIPLGPFVSNIRPSADVIETTKGAIEDSLQIRARAEVRRMNRAAPDNQELAELWTQRLATRYHNIAPDIQKSLAPVIASLPETGGNVTDILERYGPIATERYMQTTRPSQARDIMDYVDDSAYLRTSERRYRFAASQARGSGRAMAESLAEKISILGGMQEGSDSLTMAETRAAYRDTMRTAFEQQEITAYDIPSTRLHGIEAMLHAMPYAPGLRFGTSLAGIGLRRMQIGRLSSWMGARRATGDLSEAEELGLTQQITGLQVEQVQSLANLTEGATDRIPALSSGAPSFSGRIDSVGLAAYNIALTGHPRRQYGAVGGAHLARQDRFLRNLLSSPDEVAPYSRNSLDGGGIGAAATGILSQILDELRKLNGQRSGQRPGEAIGQAVALGQGKRGTGTGGSFN